MPYKDIERHKKYIKEYQKSHKKELYEKQREYVNKNRDKINADRRRYRKENKDKISMQRRRNYYLKHEEMLIKQRLIRARNPEKFRLASLKYYRNHREDILNKVATNLVHKFLNYRNRMRRKGLEFDFSRKEFIDFVNKPCHYCGDIFLNRNGIDRLDCKLGYIKNNCVPCCKRCNLMKMALSEQDFINQCKKIVSYANERISRDKHLLES